MSKHEGLVLRGIEPKIDLSDDKSKVLVCAATVGTVLVVGGVVYYHNNQGYKSFRVESGMISIPHSILERPAHSKLELLGRGSFGVVYAYKASRTKWIALKVCQNTNLLPLAEMELHRTLSHANIVKYYDCYQDPEHSHTIIIMEFAQHGSLRVYLVKLYENDKRPNDSDFLKYTVQIVRGLQYLHNLGIVHRDVRASNVLLFPNGVVKIADFGLSKQFTDDSKFDSVHGNGYWRCPEMIQASGLTNGRYGCAADIWSLGITMLEIACASRPPMFNFGREHYVIVRLCMMKVLPKIPTFVGEDVQNIIKACLVYNPDDRSTASELLVLISDALSARLSAQPSKADLLSRR